MDVWGVHANSLCLEGQEDAQLEQTVAGLQPGAGFVFAAYVRKESAGGVVLSVQGAAGSLGSAGSSETAPAVWRLVEVPFRSP